MLNERWIRALHVETMREEELHAEHGDLGLGTLNGLDGEMIAIDGAFYRADVDGVCRPRSTWSTRDLAASTHAAVERVERGG